MSKVHPGFAELVHFFGGRIVRIWLKACYRIDVRGLGNLPSGPVVYAGNHRSFLDPPMVGMWIRTPVAYFAKASLWKNPFIAFFLNGTCSIPVERDNPGLSSMKGAVERLRQGMSVCVFPEGTRTKDGRLGRLKDGPALFVRRAGVPLIPVYLYHSDRCWPRGAWFPRPFGSRLEIRFGRPMHAPAHLPPREQDAWLTRRLNAWMQRQERELLGEG